MSEAATAITPSSLKPGACVKILPAGAFRGVDGRPDNPGVWRLDPADAARLVAASQSRLVPYVIDYEHQTLNAAKNGQPAPAAGWFKRLKWVDGEGLYMTEIEWAARARTMIAANEYRYISPVFRYEKNTGVVLEILHVALTNNPALHGLTDLAAASAAAMLTRLAPFSQATGMTADELAKFKHLTGLSDAQIDEGLAASAACATQAQTGDSGGMSEKDRANFMHVFGYTTEQLAELEEEARRLS